MRLAGQEKLGYYPTPPETLRLVTSLLKPETGGLLPPEITLGLTVLLLVGAGFFFLRKRSQVRS